MFSCVQNQHLYINYAHVGYDDNLLIYNDFLYLGGSEG